MEGKQIDLVGSGQGLKQTIKASISEEAVKGYDGLIERKHYRQAAVIARNFLDRDREKNAAIKACEKYIFIGWMEKLEETKAEHRLEEPDIRHAALDVYNQYIESKRFISAALLAEHFDLGDEKVTFAATEECKKNVESGDLDLAMMSSENFKLGDGIGDDLRILEELRDLLRHN